MTIHPLLDRAIKSSKSASGQLVQLDAASIEAAKLSLSGAHGQLYNECDSCYGLKLPNTTYVGIDADGRPWSVSVPNRASSREHELSNTRSIKSEMALAKSKTQRQ